MITDVIQSKNKVEVYTTQPLCVYCKDSVSYSACWDNNTNDELNLDDIDESYGLDIVEQGDRFMVYIPRSVKCTLKKCINPNVDCTIVYKNIECDLIFDSDPIENYFDIID